MIEIIKALDEYAGGISIAALCIGLGILMGSFGIAFLVTAIRGGL